MSSVYVLEPPTKGKVVVNTNMGPIDIELWPKEAPKATRNFVQLCLDCYYDRTIFHRVIKGFLVQGGDPTASGTGGESIYGAPFADEFHSRLRFNHRGLVACANAGSPHSNGSQFFFTLDRCDWLDKKNTIFGKVTGDSIYNLLRIGEVETGKDDLPVDPQPRILSVEVLWNPFDDIIPRNLKKSAPPAKTETLEKKKPIKNLSLLSFGEEAEQEDRELETKKEKIKSLHDVIEDPRFLKDAPEDLLEDEKRKEVQKNVREALSSKKGEQKKNVSEEDTSGSGDNDEGDDDDENDGARFDTKMRLKILKMRQERGEITNKEKRLSDKRKEQSPSLTREHDEDLESQGPRVEKLSLKKKGLGSEARAELFANADTDLQLMGHAAQQRHMLKQKKRRLQGREDDTLARLSRFKQSVSMKFSAVSQSEGGGEEDDSGWMTNELKFIPDPSKKDGMVRKEDPNDYVVHDPLLEKGKEKFNKMQAKFKRREREWAGKSLT